jgi:hypothetical protein
LFRPNYPSGVLSPNLQTQPPADLASPRQSSSGGMIVAPPIPAAVMQNKAYQQQKYALTQKMNTQIQSILYKE